jgi:hypothetical protein
MFIQAAGLGESGLVQFLQKFGEFQLAEILEEGVLDCLFFGFEEGVVDEEVEAGDDEEDEGYDEGLVVGDEGEGDSSCIADLLDEGIEGPKVKNESGGQSIDVGVDRTRLVADEFLERVDQDDQHQDESETEVAEVVEHAFAGVQGHQGQILDRGRGTPLMVM